MKIGLNKFAPLLMVGALGGGLLSGCILSEDRTLSIEVASATGTVTGRIIDASSRMHVGAASVTVIVNGGKRVVKSSRSSDHDLMGRFKMGGLPAGEHTMKIEMEGYATRYGSFMIGQTFDNTPVTTNLGNIPIGASFDLTAVVTHHGAGSEGVNVFAVRSGNNGNCGWSGHNPDGLDNFANPQHAEIRGMTDATGMAVLMGLEQCAQYTIVAAAHDSDGDGNIDRATATKFYDGAVDSETTVALTTMHIDIDENPQVIDTNTMEYLNLGGGRNISDTGIDPGVDFGLGIGGDIDVFTAGGAITMIFDRPVMLGTGATDAIRMYTMNPLVNPDGDGDDAQDATYADDSQVEVTTSIDATGVMVTLTPTVATVANAFYWFEGALYATTNGTPWNFENYGFGVSGGGMAAAAPTTLAVTMDNYNGATGLGSGIAASGNTYLDFNQYVEGNFHISTVETKANTTVTTDDNTNIDFSGQANLPQGEWVYTDGSAAANCANCGTGAGVFYRVNLSGWLGGLNDGDVVVMTMDTEDLAGVRTTSTTTFTVE